MRSQARGSEASEFSNTCGDQGTFQGTLAGSILTTDHRASVFDLRGRSILRNQR